jgi:threonine/homoserine/homoserine lactone efflux protein
MNDYAQILASLVVVQILGLLSPGPDFTIVTRNSLVYGRKIGLYTALGIALGIFFHVGYTIVGIGVFIQKNPKIYQAVQMLGALYLIFIGSIGIKSFFKSKKNDEKFEVKKKCDTPMSAIKLGLFTNLLNAKAGLFFIGIFSQFFNTSTPLGFQYFCGLIIVLTTLVYFSIVAFLFSTKKLSKMIVSKLHFVEALLGLILVGLGLKMIF